MATLLDSQFYNENDLFKSDNLAKVSYSQYQVPWFYRAMFELPSNLTTADDYIQLRTHGISSRADIYLNGILVADKSVQAGAYAGLTYDISTKAKSGKNVLLIKTYPTDYNRDLALGFVDWNPYPPDNGTGIWRDIEIKQTRTFSFTGTPRVITQSSDSTGDAMIRLRMEVRNLAVRRLTGGHISCYLYDPDGNRLMEHTMDLELPSNATQKVSLQFTITNPRIWWPKQWGLQPLYRASCELFDESQRSDATPEVRFGIRTVKSTLNKHNDTTFFINGRPFQVLGAGYTSDIFLRFDEAKLRAQFQYVLDMGLNTVRLEGKQEHTRLYELADEMGLMIMAGWECCDKWEGWSYNDEGFGEKWKDADYASANISMRHEADLMQHHPSLLAFLVGSGKKYLVQIQSKILMETDVVQISGRTTAQHASMSMH